MDFLYFPENKAEYIPGLIEFIIVFFAAVWIMKFIMRISEKQLEKAKQLESEILKSEILEKERKEY